MMGRRWGWDDIRIGHDAVSSVRKESVMIEHDWRWDMDRRWTKGVTSD